MGEKMELMGNGGELPPESFAETHQQLDGTPAGSTVAGAPDEESLQVQAGEMIFPSSRPGMELAVTGGHLVRRPKKEPSSHESGSTPTVFPDMVKVGVHLVLKSAIDDNPSS